MLDIPVALSVLDPSTGEFLEHRQLRRDPRYKTTWDTSYANELGHLCQEIGSGPPPIPNGLQAPTPSLSMIIMTYYPTNKKEISHTMLPATSIANICNSFFDASIIGPYVGISMFRRPKHTIRVIVCQNTMNHGGRRRTTAAMVPHSRLRWAETLANRLCNNAT